MKRLSSRYPWRKVAEIITSIPMTWKLVLTCGHQIYKSGSIVEQALPKKCRCQFCPMETA